MVHRLSIPIILAACSAIVPAMADQTYQLEKTHVDLLFSINHAGFTEKHGQFREVDATLTYDAQTPGNSRIVVTVKADSLDTGSSDRDHHVRGDQFLDVAKYPEIRFVSTKVTAEGQSRLLVNGELTLHGVTKPLALYARLNKHAPNPFDKKPTLGFSATGSLKRSDFGITSFLPVIGDTVTLTIEAEFNRAR
jgi:polyisoprenoid-binding protein YceI